MNNILSKLLLFYPARLLRGEFVHKYMKEIKHAEKLPLKELQQFQLNKLKLLLHEHSNIPYLNSWLASQGISLDNFTDIKNLNLLPIIDKSAYKTNLTKLKNNTIKKHSKRGTSGSTGTPFLFYRDRYSLACMDAIMYNSYSWHNINIGDRQARFWGMPFAKKKRNEAILKDILMNRIRLSAFDLSDTAMSNYLHKILKFRPSYFYGYPSLIYEFAQFCRKSGYSPETIDLKAIIVTGEKLIPDQGAYIEDTFRAKLIQEYGCSEIGVIGFQCIKKKTHVMSPNVILEVIKKDTSVIDEPGEIVVTELNAKSYPFLRYKIGDRGVISSERCECGLEWPLFEINEGRRDDYIITPDGKKIYDAILAYTFNSWQAEIVAFKAVQENINSLDVMIVVSAAYNKTTKKHCISELRNVLGSKINITIRVVDTIPREKSGKLRYFVSKCNQNSGN